MKEDSQNSKYINYIKFKYLWNKTAFRKSYIEEKKPIKETSGITIVKVTSRMGRGMSSLVGDWRQGQWRGGGYQDVLFLLLGGHYTDDYKYSFNWKFSSECFS